MIELYNGDCLEIMDRLLRDGAQLDVVITDPPYPDYHEDKWPLTSIGFLGSIDCRQLIFWSARAEFPLDYTAIHIWDKAIGVGVGYERIFERNGHRGCRVFRHYFINSTVAANYGSDVFTGHPSQKPIKLMLELVEKYTKESDVVIDPFMGSGSTGVACARLGRSFIGIELDEEYFAIAKDRIEREPERMF